MAPHSALGLVFLLAGSAAQGSRAPEAHAILHAKIVVGDGTVIEKGRVVVRDGRIDLVDANDTAPPDARVIEGAGLTVYPGFVDGSAVAGIVPPPIPNEGPAADPAAGASATMREIRRKGIRPEASAVALLDVPEEAANPRRQAGFTTALFEPPAAILGGRASLADLSGRARREAIVRADVAMAAALEPPGGEPGYPTSTMGAIAQFRQAILDADWYRKSWKAHREHPNEMRMPPIDPILAALEPVLDRAMPVAFEANTSAEILRALALAEERGVRPWIVGATEGWRCAPALAQRGVPVLLSLDFGAEPKDPASRPASRPGGRAGSRPESRPEGEAGSVPASAPASRWPNPDAMPTKLREERKRRYEERIANAGLLAKAGVKLVLTTRGLRGPGEFHGALAKAVEKGLAREAALAALTTNPAELFGAKDAVGILAPGRPAHLAVVKGALGDKDLKVKHLLVGPQRYDFDEDGETPAAPPGGGRRRPRQDDGQALEGGAR